MNESHRFFICKHCRNLVGLIHASGAPMVCCGENMTELIANTTDAAGEKHVPVIQIDGDHVTIDVGTVEHPMTESHLIQWIYLQTELGGQRCALAPGQNPHAEFILAPEDKLISVFAYCNLHGLWKSDL